jgi:hypothetical protein
MKIIQQTMIENLLDQDRKFRWAGKMGQSIKAGEAVIVEGAYPTACRNRQSRNQMEAALRQGLVRVTIISNLPTAKPVGKAGSVPIPEAVKAANKETIAPAEVPVEVKGGITQTPAKDKDEKKEAVGEQRWTKVPADAPADIAKPEAVTLKGHEDTAIPKPETIEIFKDGADPGVNPEAYDPEVKRSALADTLDAAEKADHRSYRLREAD